MRNRLLKMVAAVFAVCVMVGTVNAQSAYTENTYKLDDPNVRPKATIDQVNWLVGNWVGTAFGNDFEEVWNPASAGTMVGFFKLLNEDGVVFYELLLLAEEEGSLSLKVKHFSENFHAWETKEDYINFKLVKIEPNAIHFSGLSFYRDGDDKINGYIVMKGKDGTVKEEPLTYQRR
ncbi:MAG: hypothetical protein KTR16_15900 [Acidiferrobacterales bacterium]|nr:hypothetical protein [Acidiferrobacterales bacterium]